MEKDWSLWRELGRKGFHLFSSSLIFLYIFFSNYFNEKAALLFLAILLVICLEFEYARVELGLRLPILKHIYTHFRRKKEEGALGADVYFLIGCIICLAVFDIRIAVAAILMMVFGDIASAIVGQAIGRIMVLPKRSLEGIVAELCVNLIVGVVFVRTLVDGQPWWEAGMTILGEPIWPIIILMAVTATVIETLVYKLDDNLLVPLFAGLNGQILLMALTALGLLL